MELLQHLLPNQTGLALNSWNLDTANGRIVVELSSTQAWAECPLCHCPSHRVHSHYERTLKDLPWAQFSLVLLLAVGKFFCLNDSCIRRIFSERLPALVIPWARRTVRYTEKLKAIGLALGGAAAARLSHQLGYHYSRDSILRLLSSLALPEMPTPKILGVDDFALRKGHVYGTILVDLEAHRPIALLPDRTAETLAAWLKAHPGVEILSRDRAKTYRKGMNDGAPDAIQVADRFHLLQNLEETLEKAFKGKSQVLKAVEQAQLQAEGFIVPPSPVPESTRATQKTEKRAQRLEKYEQTHALRQQGHQIKDIAHHLGIGKRTVYTYLSHPTFPEWQPSIRQRSSELDPYKPYLLEQWIDTQPQARRLFEEIQKQGYRGNYERVARYIQPLRQSYPRLNPSPEALNDLPGRGPAPTVKLSEQKPLSARRVAWLVLRRTETLDDEQEALLAKLCEQPELSEPISLAQAFLKLVRQRLPEQLDGWLTDARNSSIKAFSSFAKGLKEDYDAVKAGVTLEVSNGQVEGQNNRLKMLKRQMFGRAGLDLLSKRFILKG
jgi:transposase